MEKLTKREKEIVVFTIVAMQNMWIMHLNEYHGQDVREAIKKETENIVAVAAQINNEICEENMYLTAMKGIQNKVNESEDIVNKMAKEKFAKKK